MDKFWSFFWKLFGIAVVMAFIAACIFGIKNESAVAYTIVQYTVAGGLGACGIIGLVVVPIEMYFEDETVPIRQAASGWYFFQSPPRAGPAGRELLLPGCTSPFRAVRAEQGSGVSGRGGVCPRIFRCAGRRT